MANSNQVKMNRSAAEALIRLDVWLLPELLHTKKQAKLMEQNGKRWKGAKAFWTTVLDVPYTCPKTGTKYKSANELPAEQRKFIVSQMLSQFTCDYYTKVIYRFEAGERVAHRSEFKVKGLSFNTLYYARNTPLCQQFFQALQDIVLTDGYEWNWHRVWKGDNPKPMVLGFSKKK